MVEEVAKGEIIVKVLSDMGVFTLITFLQQSADRVYDFSLGPLERSDVVDAPTCNFNT